MDSALSEKFSCPVCFEIPEKEIFQCKNGHTVCHTCGKNLSKCPQCRVAFGKPKIRCRALEDLLDMMKFNCANKGIGCSIKLSRNEIQSHLKYCQTESFTVKLCEQLGFTCNFDMPVKSLTQALAHLKDVHDVIVCGDRNVEINFAGFCATNAKQNNMWSPVAVDMITKHGKLFIIMVLINGTDGTLSFTCLEIGDGIKTEEEESEFKANYNISAKSKSEMSNIVWSTDTIPIKYTVAALTNQIHRFPLAILRQQYIDEDGTLVVKCSIQKNIKHTESSLVKSESVYASSIPRKPIKNATLPSLISLPSKARPSPTSGGQSVCPKRCRTSECQLQSQDSSDQSTDVLYSGYSCFKCNKTPIVGIRFACLQSQTSQDLCQSCYESGEYPHHIFCIIQNPDQHNLINYYQSMIQATPGFRGTSGTKTSEDKAIIDQANYKCCGCSGLKNYICLICKPLKGYCSDCFHIANHANEHFFAATGTHEKTTKVIWAIFEKKFETLEVLRSFELCI